MSWCETEMQKYMPLVKQDVMKFEVFILGGQRIDQKRSKGWWRGSRERIEMEAQKVTGFQRLGKGSCSKRLVKY